MKKIVALLLIGVMITICGCGGNEPKTASPSSITPTSTAESNSRGEEAGATISELIVAGQEIPVSLDPVQPLTTAYLRNIGAAEALFKINADGSIRPELAESVVEIDAVTWEIKLRSGAAFWSGKAVDADAVIASLERSRELDLQAKPFLEGMTFNKADDYTIRIATDRAHMPLPLNLSYYQTAIHDATAKHDSVATMDMTGMYKVVEFVPKQKMVLEANERYWGQKPEIARIVYEEIAEEQTRVLSLLSGRSHIALNINPSSLAQFESSDKAVISATPAANTQTVYLNLKRPQLSDVRVRQALNWGINREELVLFGAEGQSTPVTTWLSSNPAYAEAKSAVYDKFDADRAGQLLDEAGWISGADGIRYKDGSPLTLRLMTWGGDKALGEALQHQWRNLGVQAEVRHGDYSLIEAARESGDWDASIEAWSTFGDEYALLSGQYSIEGRGNYGGFEDEETIGLLAQLATASTGASRRELALGINKRVAEQAPIISLFPRPQLTGISTSLHGFEAHFRQFENAINANMKLDIQ